MNRPASLLLTTFALCGLASAQVLVMPNSTTDTLVAFSPIDGSVIDSSLFALPNTVQVSAIDVNGEIWVSEQTGDRIVRYDANGLVLGTIGPTFTGGGLDNIRGMAFANGLVYVTNDGTGNGATADSLVVFDATGMHVATYALGSSPSPFSVLDFQGNLLVASSSATDDVHRYTYTGTSVGTFHDSTSIAFAHQLSLASDGNVWVAAFTTGSVLKLDATTGAIITSFTASGARGVYELDNGNIMWTNSSGAHVYDVTTQTSSLVLAGGSYHLNLFGAGEPSVTPYGTGCDGLVLSANGVPQLGNTSFALVLSNIPSISPVGFFAIGSQVVSPGVDLGVIGMAGCFSYTNLDIGLFTGSPASGGVSTFPVPIPNNPALAGFEFAAQGLAFSSTTTLGLATSNGLRITVQP